MVFNSVGFAAVRIASGSELALSVHGADAFLPACALGCAWGSSLNQLPSTTTLSFPAAAPYSRLAHGSAKSVDDIHVKALIALVCFGAH